MTFSTKSASFRCNQLSTSTWVGGLAAGWIGGLVGWWVGGGLVGQ